MWLDLAYDPERVLDEIARSMQMSLDDTLQMTNLLSMIIDFRSPFTVMHSAGVSASARALVELSGISGEKCLR